MTCITGFIAAVPTANRDAFITHADLAASAFLDHGLSAAMEGWGEDVPVGEAHSFPKAVLAEAGESVIFSFYRWPDRDAQERGFQAAMDDPRVDPARNPMPFDGRRVIWGHFEPLLELGAPRPGGFFDGFVIPVPRAARDDFAAYARACDPVFLEHGASWVAECWELDIPDGKITDFRRAVAARPDEAVVFAWVQWPDRNARDEGNAGIYTDPRLSGQSCPFDMTRMIWGGFTPVVQASRPV